MSQDIQFAFRTLRKSVGVTLLAVIALALGIGANTAIFSIVYNVLLRPIPVSDPDQVVLVYERKLDGSADRTMASPADYFAWRDASRSFSAFSPVGYWYYNVTGLERPLQVLAARVHHDFFDIMDMAPAWGRVFDPEDDDPSNPNVVVLQHRFWQQHFGGDPGVIGRTLSLDDTPYTVVGVMPSGYVYPSSVDFFVPARYTAEERAIRWRFLFVAGRLKPGVSVEQAQSELDTVASNLATEFPESNKGWGVSVVPLQEVLVEDARSSLLILLAVVGCVLLIACSNVASLLLARSLMRTREFALRSALGAGRARLMRGLLTESVLLSLAGGLLGLLFAKVTLRSLVTMMENSLTRTDTIAINQPVLLATMAISVLTGIIFGLFPAFSAVRSNLAGGLRDGGGAIGGGLRRRALFKGLVVAEVALAMVVLIGAGMMIKSLYNLNSVDLGLDKESVLTVKVSLVGDRYEEDASVIAFFDQALERVRGLPGVLKVGAINQPPLSWPATVSKFTVEGLPLPAPGEEPTANVRIIRGELLESLGIDLITGRDLERTDASDSVPVVLVNQELAQRFFPAKSAVGERITVLESTREIVGVVSNTRERGLTEPITPSIYVPHGQDASGGMTLVVRSAGDPTQLVSAVRQEIWALDSALPLEDVRTLEERVSEEMAEPRARMTLMVLAAGLALVLAAIGIYGLMAYSVSQRTGELGLRLALGARRGEVLKMVLRQSLTLVVIGLVIGLVGGVLVLGRLLQGLLFEVDPMDPQTLGFIVVLMLVVSLLSSLVPARRATQIPPHIALKER